MNLKNYLSSTTSHYILLIIALIGLLFNSCKKDRISESNTDKIQAAKSWFNAQKDLNYNPNWDKASIRVEGNNSYIVVPSNFSLNPINKININSFLVINAPTDQSHSAKIIEYVNTIVNDNDSPSLFAFVFGTKTEFPIIKGNVLLFDIKHTFLEGYGFNGDRKPNKLAVFKENRNSSRNRLATGGKQMSFDNETYDCASYYYIEWDANTGEILSSTYLYTICDGNAAGGDGGAGSGSVIPVTPNIPIDSSLVILPQNKLCSSTFVFTTVVAPGNGSRGWKESEVIGLRINVLPDNYLENIWDIVTTGSPYVTSTFNLTVGVPGDLPNAIISKETAIAANITMVQIEKSYGKIGLQALITGGTLPQRIAQLMQIQLKSIIPGAIVNVGLSGNTVPNTPKTGINCN